VLFVTWNVNSLRARLPRVAELLERHCPDVVALQETKCTPASFPESELQALGYDSVHSSGGQWSGVALLVRMPHSAEDPVLGLAGDPAPSEARWCEATVAGIRFVSAYAPNGRSLESPEYGRKLAFFHAAARRAAVIRGELAGHSLVIAGDFNVAPTDRDLHDPRAHAGLTHVSQAERGALVALMSSGELLDAFRHLHPDKQQFTWWDYRAGSFHKDIGMRIDLTLVSRELADGLISCGIDRDFRKGFKPSDHAPLLTWLTVG